MEKEFILKIVGTHIDVNDFTDEFNRLLDRLISEREAYSPIVDSRRIFTAERVDYAVRVSPKQDYKDAEESDAFGRALSPREIDRIRTFYSNNRVISQYTKGLIERMIETNKLNAYDELEHSDSNITQFISNINKFFSNQDLSIRMIALGTTKTDFRSLFDISDEILGQMKRKSRGRRPKLYTFASVEQIKKIPFGFYGIPKNLCID